MSQPVKPPVFIAIVVAAILIIGLIGYKIIAANHPPPRTDAAARELYVSMEKAREQKQGSGKGMTPSQSPPHP